MTSIVRDAIAAALLEVETVVDAPVDPFGYGSDLSCDSDLDEDMLELDGVRDARLILAQAIVRRLDCPRGRYPGDGDYGVDLRGALNRGTTATELRQMGGRIRNELSKDDRISEVAVTLTPNSTGSEIRTTLQVTPVDPSVGGFELVLAVQPGAVMIEALR